MMTTIEILQAAKERLFEKGWRRGGSGYKEGPNCATGAIMWEVETREQQQEACEALAENLVDYRGYGAIGKIQCFNDLAASFDDVIDLFDRAIKMEEVKCPRNTCTL